MMSPRWFSLLLLACTWPLATNRAATSDLRKARQCILVVTDDWESTTGTLRSFERRDATASWKKPLPDVPVVIGKNGTGLGRGLIRVQVDGAPKKQEGDNRAPAGIFRLPSAFGYASAESANWIKLPYLALSRDMEAIDDPHSRYYNQLVDRSRIKTIDWQSSERMRRDDFLYKWGVIVEHNPAALPGAGSCIFLHIWKGPSVPTTGCTAMAEENLAKLLRWLDPDKHPILVQMPRANYRSIRLKYDLPPEGELRVERR